MPTLLLRPTLDRRAYRLRCRFKIEPWPPPFRLDREKVSVAERFVVDMHKQGWENVASHGFKMTGPFPMVVPKTIPVQRMLSAREMLPGVREGYRFLDDGLTPGVSLVPALADAEWWEFELIAVFERPAVLTEVPDRHEEDYR